MVLIKGEKRARFVLRRTGRMWSSWHILDRKGIKHIRYSLCGYEATNWPNELESEYTSLAYGIDRNICSRCFKRYTVLKREVQLMATRATKPVSRETDARVFERGRRSIIITIHPCGDVELKAKGLRTGYRLPAEALYALAVKKSVEEKVKEKTKKSPKIVKRR